MLRNEIAFDSYSSATTVAKILLEQGYVVMLSKEENLVILNYEWSSNDADRNDVVFMTRERYEEILFNGGNEDE